MKPVYYNDNDAYCAQWLRNLIADGQLPAGDVDERSIEDVKPDDLVGYRQAHFFCGVGGWPLALRWAGYEDYDGLWTGSCPCQPLSSAGKRQGHADARHLWPAFYELIAQCRPTVCFGEQVSGTLGYEWLAGVRLDLEGCRYAVGAADLPVAGVGAPHIRQRLFWVADASGTGQQLGERGIQSESSTAFSNGSTLGNGRLGDTHQPRPQGRGDDAGEHARQCLAGSASADGGVPAAEGREEHAPTTNGLHAKSSNGCRLGNWTDAELIGCADGKARRVGRGLRCVAPRVPTRTSKLRAYGNAIVPQLAAVFVQAAMEAHP